jgi:hypothetical protein
MPGHTLYGKKERKKPLEIWVSHARSDRRYAPYATAPHLQEASWKSHAIRAFHEEVRDMIEDTYHIHTDVENEQFRVNSRSRHSQTSNDPSTGRSYVCIIYRKKKRKKEKKRKMSQ